MQVKVKAKGASQPLAITANRLLDGAVVWLAEAGRWSQSLADAAVFLGDAVDAGVAAGERAEAEQYVVGAYVVEMAADRLPLRARERFRAAGPSIAIPAAA
jgi:Protein of unknown function (DUF2849)